MKTTVEAIEVAQNKRRFYLTRLQASDLTEISYASVRGRDEEEGAVQRVLNPRRIASLKEFTLAGGDYPNSIVLNWIDSANKLTFKAGKLSFGVSPRSAQIIDGQHRVEGLREAIKDKKKVGDLQIPVAIYNGLDTRECADIFLSINTEQKPVPRSLVFDLYGVASEHVADPAAERANDIANKLNEEGSPYEGLIRLPGKAKAKIGIDLSTAVTALKPLVEPKGVFEQVGIKELEMETRIILNLFNVLKSWYQNKWKDPENAFMYAAGFSGAVDFMKNRLVTFCNTKKSYTEDTIRKAMQLEEANILLRSELSGLQGRAALRKVSESLVERFMPAKDDEEIEV